jgi:hypothetical protein
MPATRIKTTDDLAEILRRRHQATPSKPSLMNLVGRWRERRLTRALARTPIGDLFAALRARV